MRTLARCGVCALLLVALYGCETTNSIPYKASAANLIQLQETLKPAGVKVRLGEIVMAPGVEESLLCRLMGPVKVAPGKSLSEYVKDAFQEELFLAQVYSTDASAILSGTIDKISFSSVSPAYWDVSMTTKSNYSAGYQVNVKYNFDTSWTAYSACKNVADAFSPTVQRLLREVISHPQFKSLLQP